MVSFELIEFVVSLQSSDKLIRESGEGSGREAGREGGREGEGGRDTQRWRNAETKTQNKWQYSLSKVTFFVCLLIFFKVLVMISHTYNLQIDDKNIFFILQLLRLGIDWSKKVKMALEFCDGLSFANKF